MKNMITIVLVILAFLVAYIVFTNSSSKDKNIVANITTNSTNANNTANTTEAGNASENFPVDPEIFADQLSISDNVFIVQDLRGVSNGTSRKNIQQCGIDFAGSNGLAGKNVTILAFENNECTSLDGITDIDSCLEKMKSANVTIQIKEGTQYSFYKNKLIVGIDSSYKVGSCSISVKN